MRDVSMLYGDSLTSLRFDDWFMLRLQVAVRCSLLRYSVGSNPEHHILLRDGCPNRSRSPP